MSSTNFKNNLEKIALYNGFSAVGVTSPDLMDTKIRKRLEIYIEKKLAILDTMV